MFRALVAALAAPAFAAPAGAVSKEDGTLALDDGVSLATTVGFRGTLRIRQTARAQVVFLQARAIVSAGTTTCTPTFGLPCLGATRAAVTVRSNTVRFVIPARKK